MAFIDLPLGCGHGGLPYEFSKSKAPVFKHNQCKLNRSVPGGDEDDLGLTEPQPDSL